MSDNPQEEINKVREQMAQATLMISQALSMGRPSDRLEKLLDIYNKAPAYKRLLIFQALAGEVIARQATEEEK